MTIWSSGRPRRCSIRNKDVLASRLRETGLAATTLLTLNHAFAARGNTGGGFILPDEAAFETAAAAETGE